MMESAWSIGFALVALLSVLLLGFIGFVIHIYVLHRKYSHLPGPPRPSFFYGHLPIVKKEVQEGRTLVELFQKWSLEYDGLYLIWFFWHPRVVAYHKDVIKDVIIKYNLPKQKSLQKMLSDMFGARFMKNGLVSITNHEEWKKKRNAANPAFYRSHLKTLVSDYNKSCDKFLTKIGGMADGKTQVRMLDYFHRVTLDVIGKVAFDMELNSLDDDHSPFPTAVANCLNGILFKFRNPFHKINPSTFKYQRQVADGTRLLRETGRKCIEKRQAAIASGKTMPNDVLSTMMKLTELHGISSEDLLDDFITFFIAGQETTANQLSFLLLEVAQRPDVLEKLKAEIHEVLGSRDYVEFDDLAKLEYMGQVLKEALRLYPPAGGIARETKEQIVLGGHMIPANSLINVSIYSAHHHPDHFEDPEKFDPDRWNKENADKIDRFSYLPFSLGPRNCIGQVFAQFESKVLLARLLKNFKITLIPGQTRTIKEQGTLQPRDGVVCTLEQRR
ncbi:cholesterol 24-hydroxylase-like [Actinia tenebrosa]|uniref:Cholesterol 24-hydroxylase n=1 Tax=Actinia tenebrosa TaxID=6105 RepID=A0A6P8IKY2_ACTTE|nr:cholesterol 24-hydroxylase-like [Actinia tenebrosa]